MRYYCSLALAILAGIAVGAVGIERLPAQSAGPKAYVIVDITQINDPETFKTLLPKASRPVAEFGGQFLTRTDKITALDGVAPEQFVIIGFDSLQKAKDGTTPRVRRRLTTSARNRPSHAPLLSWLKACDCQQARAAVVLVDHCVRHPEARDHHQRARAEPRRDQGAIPGELAEVSRRFNSPARSST